MHTSQNINSKQKSSTPKDKSKTPVGKALKRKTSRRPLNLETRLSLRSIATLKLAQLSKLAHLKRGRAQTLNPENWILVAANYLSSFPPDLKGFGLNIPALRRAVTDMGFDAVELADMIELQVKLTAAWRTKESARLGRAHYIPIGMDEVGELLEIAEEERRTVGAKNIGWAGGSYEARATARKQTDRERKTIARREAGRQTRAAYEAASLSATRPWELEGISRSTWERRRARATSESADASVSATNKVTQVCPTQVCPRQIRAIDRGVSATNRLIDKGFEEAAEKAATDEASASHSDIEVIKEQGEPANEPARTESLQQSIPGHMLKLPPEMRQALGFRPYPDDFANRQMAALAAIYSRPRDSAGTDDITLAPPITLPLAA